MGAGNAVKTEVIMGGHDFDSLSADPLWELECCENRGDNGGPRF